MFEHGAGHLQIGRAYPFLRERSQPFVQVLRALKRAVDPQGLINPGVLGLAGPEPPGG
jgi:D-lactate dehydrogenase (cytochrome)